MFSCFEWQWPIWNLLGPNAQRENSLLKLMPEREITSENLTVSLKLEYFQTLSVESDNAIKIKKKSITKK